MTIVPQGQKRSSLLIRRCRGLILGINLFGSIFRYVENLDTEGTHTDHDLWAVLKQTHASICPRKD